MKFENFKLTCSVFRTVVFVLVCVVACSQSEAQELYWRQTNGPFGGEIRALAVNASGHIFAGVWAGGIFRSTDDGASWTSLRDPQRSIYSLAVNNLGHIFAVVSVTDGRILRSTNNGDSWTRADSGIPGSDVTSIFSQRNGDLYVGTPGSGIFRSTDNGMFWTNANGLGLTASYICCFASDSRGDIFIGTEDGIFNSTDNGEHWAHVGLSGIPIREIIIDDSGHMFAGYFNTVDGGIYRSIDSGRTWTKFDKGLTDKNFRALNRSSNGNLFVATTYGGVYRSTDNGENWMQTNSGLKNLFVRSLAIDSSGRVFAGTGNGVAASTNNGDTWSYIGVPHSFATSLSISREDNVFVSTYQGVFRSTDNGESWLETALAGNAILECFTINSSEYIFAGSSSNVFYSTNTGEEWHQIDSGLSTYVISFACDSNSHVYAGTESGIRRLDNDFKGWSAAGLDSFMVNSIAIAPSGNLFAGTERLIPYFHNGVFRSADGGLNWTHVLDDTTISCLLIDSYGWIIAATKSIIPKMYRSTNNGESWTVVGSGLRGNIQSLAKNSTGHIFASTPAGVFRSTDHGEHWTDVSLGLPTLTIADLCLNSKGYIFAASYGNGVYRSTQSTTDIHEPIADFPQSFWLEQNYPNPFNPTTNFEFRIANFGFVNLKIYDMLGREVATLVNENKAAGNYTIEWNASNFSSGVYFYKLQVGNNVSVKKMLLLR